MRARHAGTELVPAAGPAFVVVVDDVRVAEIDACGPLDRDVAERLAAQVGADLVRHGIDDVGVRVVPLRDAATTPPRSGRGPLG